MRDRQKYPTWVKLGLWGIPNRNTALGFLWACVALVILSLIAAFWNPLFLLGLGFGGSAAWYWAAINWVDNHDRW
jgi:hypothetical protein